MCQAVKIFPQTGIEIMDRQRIQGVLFDMDGVLVDSEPLHLQAYQELFSSLGVAYSEEDNREFLGRKDIVILEILTERHNLKRLPEELLEEKEAILAQLIKRHAIPRPGLLATLEKARALRLPVGVASSATLPTIELIVEVLGIGSYFLTLTSGDEVQEGKPAPDVYLLAARRLGIQPVRCLVIEDTAAGIRAAKAAGMYCVSIPCDATRHQDHSQADLRLNSLEEVDLESLCWARTAKSET